MDKADIITLLHLLKQDVDFSRISDCAGTFDSVRKSVVDVLNNMDQENA